MKSPLGSDEPTTVVSPLKGVIRLPDHGCGLSGQVRVFVGVRITVDTSEVTRCAAGSMRASMLAAAECATGIPTRCAGINFWFSLPCDGNADYGVVRRCWRFGAVKEFTCQQSGK